MRRMVSSGRAASASTVAASALSIRVALIGDVAVTSGKSGPDHDRLGVTVQRRCARALPCAAASRSLRSRALATIIAGLLLCARDDGVCLGAGVGLDAGDDVSECHRRPYPPTAA